MRYQFTKTSYSRAACQTQARRNRCWLKQPADTTRRQVPSSRGRSACKKQPLNNGARSCVAMRCQRTERLQRPAVVPRRLKRPGRRADVFYSFTLAGSCSRDVRRPGFHFRWLPATLTTARRISPTPERQLPVVIPAGH